MQQTSKKTPQWGQNIYNLTGCQDFEHKDPEKGDHLHLLGIKKELRGFKQLRTLKGYTKNPCELCKHLQNQTCVYTSQEIKNFQKNYKEAKPKCVICGKKLDFFSYMFADSSQNLCILCRKAQNQGELDKKVKKELQAHRTGLWSLIPELFIFLITFGSMYYQIFTTQPFTWVELLMAIILAIGMIFAGYFVVREIKKNSRRKKKLQEIEKK